MFNPFEPQAQSGNDSTFLPENAPYRPTMGAVRTSDDTEFNDALRARGIIPPKAPSRPASPENDITYSDLRHAALSVADVDTLAEAAEDASDSEDERVLLGYREKRLAEMRDLRAKARFGRVFPISRPDYTREVTEASKDGGAEGTGVVCFLYSDAVPECRLFKEHLDALAAQYSSTKFVSIIGNQCIPDYPDRNLPTLLIYRAGGIRRQIVGSKGGGTGLKGMDTTLKDLENLLLTSTALDAKPTLSDAHPFASRRDEPKRDVGRDSSDDEDGGKEVRRNGAIRRGEAADDSDSELDL